MQCVLWCSLHTVGFGPIGLYNRKQPELPSGVSTFDVWHGPYSHEIFPNCSTSLELWWVMYPLLFWLLVLNINVMFFFHSVGNNLIPTDKNRFFQRCGSTTNQYFTFTSTDHLNTTADPVLFLQASDGNVETVGVAQWEVGGQVAAPLVDLTLNYVYTLYIIIYCDYYVIDIKRLNMFIQWVNIVLRIECSINIINIYVV